MLTCINCEVEMKVTRVGVGVEQMTANGPYKLFSGDVLECPSCHTKVARTGLIPIVEHFHPNYEKTLENVGRTCRSFLNVKEKDSWYSRDKESANT